MAMDKNNVKIIYEVVDETGNGQRATFEQLGLPYPLLLELQQQVVLPMVKALTTLTESWGNGAIAKVAAQATPTPSSTQPGKSG